MYHYRKSLQSNDDNQTRRDAFEISVLTETGAESPEDLTIARAVSIPGHVNGYKTFDGVQCREIENSTSQSDLKMLKFQP